MAVKKWVKRLARISGWAMVAICLPWGLWWFWHIPTPGKGGILLALVATLMPLVWEDVRELGRAGLILTLVILFAVEYRAIDKEHKDSMDAQEASAKEQQHTLQTIGEGFNKILTDQQASFSTLIQTSQANFKSLLESEQQHFDRSMEANLRAQRQERHDFESLLAKEQELYTHQEELYEFTSGKLLPANEPTPANKCNPPVGDDEFAVFTGESTTVTSTFPFEVLRVGDSTVSLDKSADGALLVSIDLRTTDYRIIALIDKNNSLVNTALGILMSRDKHSLVLRDQYGKEILNVHYLNKHAVRISGEIPHGKGTFSIDHPDNFSYACFRCKYCMGAIDIR